MSETIKRPYIVSIAGLDPSGGAGILADIKVFEQMGLMGFGVATALTFQNENEFKGIQWHTESSIQKQLDPLCRYPITIAKIGLIESLDMLDSIIQYLEAHFPGILLVWDPVIQSSSGFHFQNISDLDRLHQVLQRIYCITPNIPEAEKLGGKDALSNAKTLSAYCHVWLKGGHSNTPTSTDILLRNGNIIDQIEAKRLSGKGKHGSGCVFSSALAAALALGFNLNKAGRLAKSYTTQFLQSTDTQLGQHKNYERKVD